MITSNNRGVGDRKLTINDLRTPEIIEKFPRHYLPSITSIAADDAIFIVPSKHVIGTSVDYYIKYLVLDNNQVPIHGHDYPYVELPRVGYILKIVIPYNTLETFEFSLAYLLDINNIEIQTVSTMKDLTNNLDNLDTEMVNTYGFTAFDSSMCAQPLVNLLSDKNKFFNMYIKDAIQ